MPTIDCGHWNGRRNRLPHLAGRWGRRFGFACRWKLISIAHPNPENGYAPGTQECVRHVGDQPGPTWLSRECQPAADSALPVKLEGQLQLARRVQQVAVTGQAAEAL